jgi:hypothetical protein
MIDNYEDPVIKKYLDTIKGIIGDTIKTYYIEDPIRIPSSNLPALIISSSETRVAKSTNIEDEHGMSFILTVITDIRQDIQDDKSVAGSKRKLKDIIEGRDSNYKLKTNSILHILRTNINLDVAKNLRTDLTTVTRVDYGITVGKRQPEAWGIEAQVEFVAEFIQLRN